MSQEKLEELQAELLRKVPIVVKNKPQKAYEIEKKILNLIKK